MAYFLWFIVIVFSILQASAWVGSPPVQHLGEPIAARSVDLDSIQRRDTLRVITRNTATTYFLYRGGEHGFEYEMARELARRLGVQVQMVVPPSWDDAIPWLAEGKGDIVAPGFLMTPPGAAGAVRSDSYDATYLTVVTRAEDGPLRSPDGLVGHTVHVRENSPAHFALADLSARLDGRVAIVTVPSTWDTETILSLVADGDIGATAAPWPVAQIEQSYHPELHVGPALTEPDSVAWFVRPDAPRLLSAVNSYFRDVRRSAFYNVLKDKYFEQTSRFTRYKTAHVRFIRYGVISPYDTIIKRHARRAGLDWLLVAATISVESGFNPRAQSWAGAMGLMQLMPQTVEAFSLDDPWSPAQNVEAGVSYLAAQIARFDTLGPYDALAFGLASYNAGVGHVQDARQVALKEGLDPDRWAGNVETALGLLSHERYYSRAAFGYVRGSETVAYVNGVLRRWEVYRTLLNRPNGPPIL